MSVDLDRLILGDSISAGYGLPAGGQGWAAQTAPSPPSPAIQAIPGWMAGDAANLVWGNSYPVTTLPPPIIPYSLCVLLGTNDSYVYGLDPARQPIYARCMRALLARGAMPQYIATRSGQCSRSAGWNNTGVNQIGVYATTQGAALSAVVTGTSIYIGGLVYDGSGGTADVYVDGNRVGSISTYGKCDTGAEIKAGNGYYWAAVADRFGGLSPGSHTVEIVVTSTNGGYVFVDWIAGNAQPFSSRLLVGNLPPVLASGYAIDVYNGILVQTVGEFAADSFDARIVNVHDAIDPNTMLQPDKVHPLQTGQNSIAQTFWQALNGG